MTKGRAAYLGVLVMLALAFALSAVDAAILTAGAAALEPHGPYASTNNSCAVCHDVHGSTVGRKLLGPDGGTAATETDVCFACHGTGGSSGWDVETAGVQNSFGLTPSSGHSVEEAAADPDLTNYCSSCHGPHGDPNDGEDDLPKLEINGFTVDRATDPNSWCEACHDPDRPATENWSGETGDAYYDQIFTSRDADTYITFGTFRGWDAYNSTSAHALIPADSFVNPVNASDTVVRAEGDCLWCHSSHRSENIYDNLVGEFGPTSWAVCDDCHLVLNPAGDWGTGHIIDDAASPLDGLPLPCYECHNAHGSKNGNTMLAQDSLGQLLNPDSDSTTYTVETQAQFCYTCHLSSDGYGWNSYASPPAMEPWATLQSVPGITTTVAGIARADMIVLPPSIAQHDSGTLVGCSCHGSVHAPGPGVSDGGKPCYDCHMALEDDMEWDNAGVAPYGHAVGTSSTDGDTTSYPDYTTDSKSNVYCLSCHMDHTFNSDQGLNLRTSVDVAATAARTDHAVGTASGLCVSCHSVAVGTVTYTVAGSDYQGKAHDYIVDDAATVGYDGTSAFNPNCTKCHTDPVGLDGRQDGLYKIAPHFSDDESRLAKALGATLTGTSSTEENLCFECHSPSSALYKSTSLVDGYGLQGMSAESEAVWDQVTNLSSGHKVGSYSDTHTSVETTFDSTNKHIECEDCHNPHAAGTTPDTLGGVNGNAINPTASPLAGVRGVAVTYSAASWLDKTLPITEPVAYSFDTGTDYAEHEYEICFKCHSGFNTAYSPPAAVGGNGSWTNWGGTGADAWTNVAIEFNPNNASYHPVYQGTGARSTNLTNRFVAAWRTTNQTMTCSDCHQSMTASSTAYGPHGSAVKHIVRGYWPTNAADGTGTLYTPANGPGDSNLLCWSCHNAGNYLSASTAHDSRHNGQYCVDCHLMVPHGSKLDGLVGDGDGDMPSRYARANTEANMRFRGYGGNPTDRNNCGCIDRTGTHPVTNGSDW